MTQKSPLDQLAQRMTQSSKQVDHPKSVFETFRKTPDGPSGDPAKSSTEGSPIDRLAKSIAAKTDLSHEQIGEKSKNVTGRLQEAWGTRYADNMKAVQSYIEEWEKP